MDRHRFNSSVRPHLTEIPIGTQGIAFDRLELDAWADEYRSRFEKPGRPTTDEKVPQGRVDWTKSAGEITAQIKGRAD